MVTLSLIDISPGLVFWSVLAFVTLLVVLSKFAWKPILNAVHTRENSIADAIQSADKIKKEMEEMKADNAQLMQQAREEKAEMLRQAREIKDKIIAEAEVEAKEKADKIMADAQVQITNEKNAALIDVKNQVGNLVMEVSEKVMRKEMGKTDVQMDYVNQLTDEIKLN